MIQIKHSQKKVTVIRLVLDNRCLVVVKKNRDIFGLQLDIDRRPMPLANQNAGIVLHS